MSVADGTILKVVVSMIWLDGNIMQNVFNLVVAGGSPPYDVDDVLDEIETWLDTLYANITTFVSDELDGSVFHVYEYDAGDDDWDEIGSLPWTWNPSNVGDQLPRGNAGLINLKTYNPDVSGKKYVGGWTETGIEGGVFSAASLAALAAYAIDWYTAFVGGTTGATYGVGVWSVAKTNFFLAVASVVIPAIVAYQRRRKRGVGI